MATFLVLSDAEYEALVIVLGAYKLGLEHARIQRLDPELALDCELKLVAGLERKLKDAG